MSTDPEVLRAQAMTDAAKIVYGPIEGPFPAIPPRTELTTRPADPESPKKIGWTCYELTGTDIYPIPEGQEPTLDLVKETNLIIREGDLVEGMHLLIHDLFGWGHGVVHPDRTCRSLSGKTLFFLKFVNDRPAKTDGTPSPPRWVCTGSGNLAAVRKMEITT